MRLLVEKPDKMVFGEVTVKPTDRIHLFVRFLWIWKAFGSLFKVFFFIRGWSQESGK